MHPARHGHPLRRKGLQLIHCVERRVVEKAADKLQALVIGYVRRRLLVQRPAIEVMRKIRLDDRGRDGRADGECCDRHCERREKYAEVSEVPARPRFAQWS